MAIHSHLIARFGRFDFFDALLQIGRVLASVVHDRYALGHISIRLQAQSRPGHTFAA